MSRSINEIKNIFLAIQRIFHLYGMALDGYPAFFLKVHIVEHLSFSNLNGIGMLKQTVGNSRLSVVYMGYDTEVSYIVHCRLISIFLLKSSILGPSHIPFNLQKYE